jgi:diamine N-acetyltransferase
MPLFLKNDVLILRGMEPEDLDFLYACENDPEVWHLSNTLAPYSKFVLKQYLENSHHDIYTNKQLRLIIAKKETPEKALGAIDLFDFDPFHQRAGIGILIHNAEERGKGYADISLNLLIDYCFKYLKLHQVYCNIAADNKVSIKLFEKCGFTHSGTKKEWLNQSDGWQDELMFQKLNPKIRQH